MKITRFLNSSLIALMTFFHTGFATENDNAQETFQVIKQVPVLPNFEVPEGNYRLKPILEGQINFNLDATLKNIFQHDERIREKAIDELNLDPRIEVKFETFPAHFTDLDCNVGAETYAKYKKTIEENVEKRVCTYEMLYQVAYFYEGAGVETKEEETKYRVTFSFSPNQQ
jgi:hypothetical protein